MFDNDTQFEVNFCGGRYTINKDIRIRTQSNPHPPCWYVQRLNDERTSKRYYSRPAGAFLALTEGAVQWVS